MADRPKTAHLSFPHGDVPLNRSEHYGDSFDASSTLTGTYLY